MERRNFVKGMMGLTSLGALTGFYTWQLEPFWLEFVKKKMPVRNLPENLIGKTLMQISDIHVGNRFDYAYLIESFEKAQKLNPDFVVYTGDYVSYEESRQLEQLAEVLKSTVRGRLGTVGILGNHDYGKDWAENEVAEKITGQLRNAGVQVLRNEQVAIEGLNFIGFDDYWASNFKPEEVMAQYDGQKAHVLFAIILMFAI